MRTAEMMGGLQSVFDDEGNQTFDDSRIFFGYEYMSVRAALAYAIFDDSLTGALDEDSIKLTEVVLDLIAKLGSLSLSSTERDKLANNDVSAIENSKVDEKPLLNEIIRVPTRLSMMELGFTPTFYQFVDTIIEVKIAIKMTRSYESSRTTSNASRDRSSSSKRSKRGGGLMGLFGGKRSRGYAGKSSVQTTQVDATYSAKYSYSAEGASLLRTKLVPVPPPAVLEERIRGFIEIEEEARRARLAANNPAEDDNG